MVPLDLLLFTPNAKKCKSSREDFIDDYRQKLLEWKMPDECCENAGKMISQINSDVIRTPCSQFCIAIGLFDPPPHRKK